MKLRTLGALCAGIVLAQAGPALSQAPQSQGPQSQGPQSQGPRSQR